MDILGFGQLGCRVRGWVRDIQTFFCGRGKISINFWVLPKTRGEGEGGCQIFWPFSKGCTVSTLLLLLRPKKTIEQIAQNLEEVVGVLG